MRRLILILTLTTALFGLVRPTLAAGSARTDRMLVDKLVVLFEQMAQNPIKIDLVLDELMASAKKAKAEQRIDGQFYDRYSRLLLIFKLMTLEDKEGILRSIGDRECVAFIKDVQGGAAPSECTVPLLAKAITQELESLKN